MLKVQLKKYVGAVQMLKREGQTAEGEVEHGGGTDCWMGRLQEWMNTYSTE